MLKDVEVSFHGIVMARSAGSENVPEVRSKSCPFIFWCWLCILRLCDAERDKSSIVVLMAIHDQSLS